MRPNPLQKTHLARGMRRIRRSGRTNAAFLLVVLTVQIGCAYFFVSDIIMTILGLRSTAISWQVREIQQIGAAVGLIVGPFLGALALRRALRRSDAAEKRLRLASGVFMEHLAERFEAWGLTPAERDVALFAIKGLSTSEISQLRATSEGTVKAQTYAIYRKAGVPGRAQLISLFVEDLMGDSLPLPSAQTGPAARLVQLRSSE